MDVGQTKRFGLHLAQNVNLSCYRAQILRCCGAVCPESLRYDSQNLHGAHPKKRD